MKKYFILLSDPAQKTFPAGHPKECIDYIWMYREKDGGVPCEGTQGN